MEERYDLGFVAIYFVLSVCALNIAGVFYNLILSLKLAYLKQKHKKAWKKYNEINDQMIEFILRDFIKVKELKLNEKQKQENRDILRENYTF